MAPIIIDKIESFKELINGMKFETDSYTFDQEFASKAKKALILVKGDALYVAQLFRKYYVKKDNYDARMSFQDIVTPRSPLEEELNKYSQAKKAITAAVNMSNLPIGAQINMVHALRDLYFNLQYQLPKLK